VQLPSFVDKGGKFLDGFQQSFAFKGIGKEVVGYLAHAADDFIDVFARFVDNYLVGWIIYFNAVNIELDRRQDRAQPVVQVRGNALSFIFLDRYFGQDTFFLQANVPAVVAHDGNNKVGDDDANQQGQYHNCFIKLIFPLAHDKTVVSTKHCKDNRSLLLFFQEDISVQQRFPGYEINADGVEDIGECVNIHPDFKYARKGLIMTIIGGKNVKNDDGIYEKNNKPNTYDKQGVPADSTVVIDHLVIDGINAQQYNQERIRNQEHRVKGSDIRYDKILRCPAGKGSRQQHRQQHLKAPEPPPVIKLRQQQQAFHQVEYLPVDSGGIFAGITREVQPYKKFVEQRIEYIVKKRAVTGIRITVPYQPYYCRKYNR
jgi:hypothetical protein